MQVEPPKAQPAAAPPPIAPKPDKRVAVLVCHGMGQQVQFETLDAVVREVRETALRCGTLVSEKEGVGVSIHPDEGRFVARAELNLKRKDQNESRRRSILRGNGRVTRGGVTLLRTIPSAGAGRRIELRLRRWRGSTAGCSRAGRNSRFRQTGSPARRGLGDLHHRALVETG